MVSGVGMLGRTVEKVVRVHDEQNVFLVSQSEGTPKTRPLWERACSFTELEGPQYLELEKPRER